MNTGRIRTAFGAIALLALACSAAQAAEYVSSTGVDTGNCSNRNGNAPCRTISYALRQGNNVVVLDSADYTKGSLLVNGNATITAPPGSLAILRGELNILGNGTVTLDGLTIYAEINGITVAESTNLNIRNCVIWNSQNTAIEFSRSASGTLLVENATIWHALNGIRINNGVTATIDHSRFLDISGVALRVDQSEIPAGSAVGATSAVVRDSIFVGDLTATHPSIGVEAYASGPSSAAADVEVFNSTFSYFNVALMSNYAGASGLSNVTVTNSNVMQNCTGFVQQGTVGAGGPPGSYFNSFRNNSLRDNGAQLPNCVGGGDTQGTITAVSLQ